MKLIGALLLSALSINTHAESQNIKLQCQEHKEGTNSKLTLSTTGIKFEISNSQKSCKSEFTYSKSTEGKELFIIKSWPTSDEFGENAQNDIFISSSPDKKAIYIGSIPVSANFINEKTYKNISQVGGSIYETIYIINANAISIQQPSKELMFSDTQCIYLKKDSNTCKNITGTFETPICIYNIEGRKILEEPSNCSSLSLE